MWLQNVVGCKEDMMITLKNRTKPEREVRGEGSRGKLLRQAGLM